MADPRQDLGEYDVVAGDPLTITVQVTNVNFLSIAPTWTATAAPGAAPSQPTVPFAVTVSTTNSTNDTLTLKLTGAQTTSMESGGTKVWYFDIVGTGGTVTPQTPFKGSVAVYRGVTNG